MSLSSHPKLTSEELSKRLDDLRVRFAERAIEDEHAICEALRQQDRPRLRERAHRLAGTAPSFGLAEIGAAARLLDQLLEEGAAGGEVNEAARRLIDLLGRCGSA